MERLNQPTKKGISKQQVFLFGMLFLLAGVISRSVLQNRVLHMGSLTGQQLLEAMSASETAIVTATVALVLQALHRTRWCRLRHRARNKHNIGTAGCTLGCKREAHLTRRIVPDETYRVYLFIGGTGCYEHFFPFQQRLA